MSSPATTGPVIQPRAISKDTQLCISLAGRPSNIGTRFHNYLYAQLGLDFVYKAFTTTDLPAAIGGVRALGIRGCGVSMPFKEDVIALVDELDDSARVIESVNTIVNTAGRLQAYNTDYIAVATLLRQRQVPPDRPFAVSGSGGMAKAVVAALRDAGFASGVVVARNEGAGRTLAQRYGYQWRPDFGGLEPHLIVNATPVGMAGGPASDLLAAPPDVLGRAGVIFDVVAVPEQTPMVRFARERDIPAITGGEVIALQAAEQFHLYTGVRPDAELVGRASAYSRANPPAT